MRTNYTYYLKLADLDCKIITDDDQLATYLTDEYWLFNNNHKPDLTIKIKKTNYGHIIEDERGKLLKKIIASEINKVDYLRHIDFVLMLILKKKCISDNILLFHGSAYTKNSRGYVFLGPVGAGKSTIIRNIPKQNLLADDTVVVKKTRNKLLIYPSPFDKKRVFLGEIKPVPLYRIYFLDQSNTNRTINLRTEDKLLGLFQNTFRTESYYMIKHKKQNKYYQLVLELVSKINILKLLFTKDFDPYQELI